EISSDDPFSIEKMEAANRIAQDIMSISPSTHFIELITGPQQYGIQLTGQGDRQNKGQVMQGLFDTGFTLGDWAGQNWVSLVILIAMPFILLLISYIAFMRQDITL
ncbi:MAG TPA: hypothetical protein VIO11_01545, partial [Candidatus Methanoperedens sp.]